MRGTTFVWAFAPSNETTRSMMAIALGLAPNRIHGRFADPPRLDPRHIALTERLRAGGYQTAGFLCCELWSPRSGLPRGLEHVEVEPDRATLVSDARTWLTAREADHEPSRPALFVWVHLAEPRDWAVGTTEPRTDVERKRLYDHQLALADAAVGEILGVFTARLAADAPIVIVTSDHGEPLGDHGQLEAGTDLFDSQIRVPLVIAGAGIKPQRTEEVVGLVDLAPTIIELAGFTPPYGRALDGRSLYDLATGRRATDLPQGRAFAISASGALSVLVRTNWKLLINTGIAELYDVVGDPDEHANVAISHAQLVQQLRTMADEHLDGAKRLPF
jgi:arylsulfatase A-like enzyme